MMEVSLWWDVEWNRSVLMKFLLNCLRYVWYNWVLSIRSLSFFYYVFIFGFVVKMIVWVFFVLRFFES